MLCKLCCYEGSIKRVYQRVCQRVCQSVSEGVSEGVSESVSEGVSEDVSTCACPHPHPDGDVGELRLVAPRGVRDDLGARREDMLVGEAPREGLLLEVRRRRRRRRRRKRRRTRRTRRRDKVEESERMNEGERG